MLRAIERQFQPFNPSGVDMQPRHRYCGIALAALSLPTAAAEPLRFEWDLRLRHEHVDDVALAQDATADTLRLRAGLRFDFGHGWSALLEGEGVASANDRYNSGANGQTGYPAILDPSGAELNQAWLGWRGTQAAALLGRQRIVLDNQRFVGNVGWRQNEQTFDALALETRPAEGLALRYDWLDRVHRVAGDDARDPLARERDLDTHLLNAALQRGAQQWVGYAYLHDDNDLATASTATYGLRWTGNRKHEAMTWGWSAEYARQRDHAGNPLSFAHDYWLLEPSLQAHGVTWKAGWEHLGGDGRHALQTPLASLHAFNGWADKFLVTPPGGLEDVYVGAGGKFGRGRAAGKFAWALAWHDYRADQGGDYGSEWDASLGFPLPGGIGGLVKLADYRSDGFARDTTKLWLQLEWKRP
jgi:hypothetical protein